MVRLSVILFALVSVVMACGGSSQTSDVTATCNQKKLESCLAGRGGDACYAKSGCKKPGSSRGQSTRECRISGICE